MKLCMFSPKGHDLERGWPGRIEGDRVIQLAAQTLQSFFTGGGEAREHDAYLLSEIVLRAPVLHPPSVRIFGAGDFAHDIRLACHGLDRDDNDFIVGLVGKELFPLSAVVQAMRRTQQTALYLDRLGPFFVGRAVWQSRI